MANPSLQIGNSNWAIKEDNLLGYSTAGTRFVPQPITMTRESAGTRVNSSGLVETVELFGSELVDCGDFECASPESVWTKSGGWSITDKATNSGSGGQIYPVSNSWVSGSTVRFLITVSNRTTGYIRIQNPSVSVYYQNNINTNDSFIFEFTTVDSAGWKIEAVGGFDGSVDNISVKEYTANNLARVDYDGTASSLLVEPTRTNLVTESSDFTTWTTTGSAEVTPNTTISPDGTQNADTLNIFSGNFFYKPITSGAGTFTLSCYVKVASGTLDFKMQSFNGTDGADASSTFTANTNWQRFEFTTTVTTDSNFYPIQVSGLTGGDFQIWGASLEVGSYPTSYIPTDGGTVTRVKDQYSKTGISNLINSEEGTFFLDLALLSGNTNYDLQTSIVLSDGGANNRVLIYSPTTPQNRYIALIKSEGNTVIQKTIDATDITLFNKIAVTWKTNEYKIFLNGNPIYSNTTPTATPIGLNSLFFAAYNSTANPFYGKVKQLQIFKTALTDSELIALTTI